MKKAMIDYMQNIKNDELYTPEYAIKPLLKYLPKNKIIWECTDYGSSNITKISNWFNTSWFCYNVLPKQLIFEELKKDE